MDRYGSIPGEDRLRNLLSTIEKIIIISTIILILWTTWRIGNYLSWSWADFWSNFFSNGWSSAGIAVFLYWVITRPDEKKAGTQRRAQALAMLKIEFEINLRRAILYKNSLVDPTRDFSTLYPLRFTRGAWNALKESGFLPQLNDMTFVYQLLRVNEIITVANSSLSTIRRSKADNKKSKLNLYVEKAVKECIQIEAHLVPLLVKFEEMELPLVQIETEDLVDDIPEENPGNIDEDAD